MSNLIDELHAASFQNFDMFKSVLQSLCETEWAFSSDSAASKRYPVTPFKMLSSDILAGITKIADVVPHRSKAQEVAKNRLIKAYQKSCYYSVKKQANLHAQAVTASNDKGAINRIVTELMRLKT
jgi:hypothetical protein